MFWPKPIDYNWRGQRLQLAHPGQTVELQPFGASSPARCSARIVEIDEPKQTVLLDDGRIRLPITFDDWQWMRATLMIPTRGRRNPSIFGRTL